MIVSKSVFLTAIAEEEIEPYKKYKAYKIERKRSMGSLVKYFKGYRGATIHVLGLTPFQLH
jgi:hypothetical protein